MDKPIPKEKARPIVRKLVKKRVTNFKLYQNLMGRFISFDFNGDTINYRIIPKPHNPKKGSWSRIYPEVHIGEGTYSIGEIKSMAFHQAMLKYLWENYRLNWKEESVVVAEALERTIAREVGISWPAWKMREEMEGPVIT